MTITYYYDEDGQEIHATLTDDNGKEHYLPAIIGDFEDKLDMELAAIDEADRLELLTRDQKRELQKKAYQREEMRERGRKRWVNIPPEERKKHSKMMNKKQGK